VSQEGDSGDEHPIENGWRERLHAAY